MLYDKQPTVQGEHSGRPVKLFKPQDFRFNDDNKTCICPAGQTLRSPGSIYTTRTGLRYQVFSAKAADCQSCALRAQCLKSESSERGKQVSRFEPRAKDPQNPSERMRFAIDSARGRHMYSQRIGTVEPVFGNIRHNKGLARPEPARTRESQCAVAPVLQGEQHRDAGQQRVEAVRETEGLESAPKPRITGTMAA